MLQSTFRCIASGRSSLDAAAKVEVRVRTGKPRPGKRKIGVKLHRSLVETSGFSYYVGRVGEVAACFKSQPAQVSVVSLGVVGRLGGDHLLFVTSYFRSQLLGDGFGHFALDRKDVGQFAIKRIGPKM